MKEFERIQLSSGILLVEEIVGKTSAKMFKDLVVGDRLLITIDVDYAGGNRGTYASYMKVTRIRKSEPDIYVWKSFNQLPSILKNFKLRRG